MGIRGEVSAVGLLRGLRHGFEIISSVNWLSTSRLRVVAVAVGATCLILTVRDVKNRSLLSSEPKKETSDSPERLSLLAGLQNHGNNCFLNVILQALASCSRFHPFIRDVIERDGLSVEEQNESMPFTVALFSLSRGLCVLHNEKMVLSPRRVMLAMDQYIPSFNLTRQQDAAEALLHILSCLKEELLDSYGRDCTSFADILDVLPYRIAHS